MGRFVVLDVVFYGNSLNYDQGTGTYQELKKITKWDGKQYSLVSRYALRYSLLETARKMGLWEIADGSKLQEAGEKGKTVIQPSGEKDELEKKRKTVIQPSTDILLSGEILKYPEFDLFGYLITSTEPQNFRTAPVKISHAVSMTPFSYDALFNANIGLANRMRKVKGEMSPNPFTAEEHETFYLYTVVVDVDNIGTVEIYLKKDGNIKLKDDTKDWTIKEIDDSGGKIKLKLKSKSENVEILQVNEVDGQLSKLGDLAIIKYTLKNVAQDNIEVDPIKMRIKQLISALLNLKRSIKGREEDLSPKLLVVGVYKNKPYRTYKDRIFLKDEYTEEIIDEIEEENKDGKRVMKVKHVISKSKKPVFEVTLNKNVNAEIISENSILSLIDKLFNNNNEEIEEVKVFYDPSIEVKVK